MSLVLNNYNYGEFVGDAIDSALGQDWTDLEVVVVDDGSTDDSLDVLARYADRVVTVTQTNSGQGAAFNAGAKVATGEVVCLLDSDDIARPSRAKAVAEALDRHPDAGWCFHPLDYVGGALPVPEVAAGPADERDAIRRGRAPRTFAPATSGLAFRATLLDEILPMPAIQISADNYLKVIALAVSPGVVLSEAHGVLRLHGANAYSGLPATDERQLLSEFAVSTALLGRSETRRYALHRGMGALKASGAQHSPAMAAARAQFFSACSTRERLTVRVHGAMWRARGHRR